MANINQIQLPDGSNYNLKDSVSGYASEAYVDSAVAAIDKVSVGLGNVDNTSDLNKPVSTATQTALNAKTNNTVIAPVEASTTASRRYEIGDQFILSGVLYTATAIIANGGTITVGTNCTASDTIVEQMADIQPDLSAVVPKTDVATVESGTTASRAYAVGELVYVSGTLYKVILAIASGATFTVGTNIKATNISDKEINTISDRINITDYNSASNVYTFPSDGYLVADSRDSSTYIFIRFGAQGSASSNLPSISARGANVNTPVYVKKGMNAYVENKSGSQCYAWFFPFG